MGPLKMISGIVQIESKEIFLLIHSNFYVHAEEAFFIVFFVSQATTSFS